MNLLFLPKRESRTELRTGEEAFIHLTQTLRVTADQTLETGIWDGPRGKSVVVEIDPNSVVLENEWLDSPAHPGYPITLVLGCCRPIQAQRILRECSCLGVDKIVWLTSDKGEASYAQSSLWKNQQWLSFVREGAAQAFSTHGPEVIPPQPFQQWLETAPASPKTLRILLDPYETNYSLMDRMPKSGDALGPVELWVGPERGWSRAEREQLSESGLLPAHLGPRILRTEMACTVATAQIIPHYPEFRAHLEVYPDLNEDC